MSRHPGHSDTARGQPRRPGTSLGADRHQETDQRRGSKELRPVTGRFVDPDLDLPSSAILTYPVSKLRDVVRRIAKEAKRQNLGFVLEREGAKHTVSNLGGLMVPIPDTARSAKA